MKRTQIQAALALAASTVLFAGPAASQPQDRVQQKVQIGDYFEFERVTTDAGRSPVTSTSRLHLWAYTDSWNIIVAAVEDASVPAGGSPARARASHLLDRDECAFDVSTGLSIADLSFCSNPTRAHRSLEARDRDRRDFKCRAPGSKPEKLVVPAGEFDTVRILCETSSKGANRNQTAYWYAPAIGIMVAAERTLLGADGAKASFETEKLLVLRHEVPTSRVVQVSSNRWPGFGALGKIEELVLETTCAGFMMEPTDVTGKPEGFVGPKTNPARPNRVPEYPHEARRANEQGAVQISLFINETGEVVRARSESDASIPRLANGVLTQAARWRFLPAQLNDKPVCAWTHIPIKFALGDPVAQ